MEEKQNRELEQRYQKLESKKTLLMKLDEQIPWQYYSVKPQSLLVRENAECRMQNYFSRKNNISEFP